MPGHGAKYSRSGKRMRPVTTTRTYTTKAKSARKKKVETARSVASKAMRLAKANSTRLYGRFQINLQHFRGGIGFDEKSPVCFHMMTPAVNEPVYQYLPDPATPANYTLQTPTEFLHPSLVQLTGAGPAAQGFLPWSQWSSANDDAINGKYKLLNTKLTFRVNLRGTNSTRIRIDFVKPKWNRIFRELTTVNPQNGENHMLPDSLGSFTGLLGPNNQINPMYWKYCRKPLFMHCAPGNNLTTDTIQKTIRIKHMTVLNPAEQAGSFAPYTTISVNKQMWCVVSCDTDAGSTIKPELVVTRVVTWRDERGHAA